MKKKNIVYFYCDELRCDALGCYGNEYGNMQTPNIDEIAKRGVRFTNHFCNSPVCVPSRMSQLSALYPKDTGVFHNEAGMPSYRLTQSYEYLPAYLSKHGMVSANFGKLHLPYGVQPFSYHDPCGSSMKALHHPQITNKISPKKAFQSVIGGTWPTSIPYPPDEVCEHAMDWIKQQKDPYFVRISFLQPHTPVVVKPPYDHLYDSIPFPQKIQYDKTSSQFERRFSELIGLDSLNEQEVQVMYRDYYGLVAWIDAQVGKVLDFLKANGTYEDTILIFSADHGAMRGENGCLAKQIFAPSAHRVPLLIADPSRKDQESVCTQLCESIDLAKTICGMLDLKAHTQFKGRDLFHEKEPEFVYAQIGYGEANSYAFPAKQYGTYDEHHGWPQRSCIRTQRYRLDMNTRINGHRPMKEEEDVFFTDCTKDPKERKNLVQESAYQEIINNMKHQLLKHGKDAQTGDYQALLQFDREIQAYKENTGKEGN